MLEFITPENIAIAAIVILFIVNSQYFATKLDVANLKIEIAHLEKDLKKYSDDADLKLLDKIDSKFSEVIAKIERLHK